MTSTTATTTSITTTPKNSRIEVALSVSINSYESGWQYHTDVVQALRRATGKLWRNGQTVRTIAKLDCGLTIQGTYSSNGTFTSSFASGDGATRINEASAVSFITRAVKAAKDDTPVYSNPDHSHTPAIDAALPLGAIELPGETTIPVGLQTPEGAQRVAKAMAEWEGTHAEVANRLTQFFERWADYIMDTDDPEAFKDEKDEMQDLIQYRAEKQDAFLRAVAGIGGAR